jgi:hypothetical protein
MVVFRSGSARPLWDLIVAPGGSLATAAAATPGFRPRRLVQAFEPAGAPPAPLHPARLRSPVELEHTVA